MKLKLTTAIAACAIFATPVLAEDMKSLAMEGKGVIKAFGGTLKKELVSAMKSGGPIKAVKVCNIVAPDNCQQSFGRQRLDCFSLEPQIA